MPARIAVRPPARPSNGALTLRRSIGDSARVVRHERIPSQYRYIINWGNSAPLHPAGQPRVLNSPSAISRASNKLVALETLQRESVKVPEFSTTAPQLQDNSIWLARTVLNGSQGRGIVVLREGSNIPRAPLYVKYIRKQREFRVHVVGDKAVFIQEKKRRNNAEQTADERLIRNYDNGWVFTIQGISVDESSLAPLIEEAKKAVVALGLDFGAVDCILEKRTNTPYILEVNTAPGLSSPSLITAYTDAFRSICNDGN